MKQLKISSGNHFDGYYIHDIESDEQLREKIDEYLTSKYDEIIEVCNDRAADFVEVNFPTMEDYLDSDKKIDEILSALNFEIDYFRNMAKPGVVDGLEFELLDDDFKYSEGYHPVVKH